MRHQTARRTHAQLEALGVMPSARTIGGVSNRERYASPQKGEIPDAPVGASLHRTRARFYHRVLKSGHKPHWYRLEGFEGAYATGELCRADFKRGNVIAYCDPAGCGDIKYLHPFKAGAPETPANTRGLLKAMQPSVGPMRSETAVSWVNATGRALSDS